MGPGELALVLLLFAAISSATWVARDARRRRASEVTAIVASLLSLLTFPFGPLVYARWRRRLG